ncbi:MAG TPA: RidA family protein [Planctomycetota bacterium]|nr:RidA family protein [Planctomycetota bacterium]
MASQRQNISSGSPFEPKIGFSRAVKVGNFISVSGTAPIGTDGKVACKGDAAGQARRSLEIIKGVLEKAGANMSNVVRTRLLLTDIKDWEKVAAVHGEYFGTIRPATTFLQVAKLIDPDWLIEIEVDAIVG